MDKNNLSHPTQRETFLMLMLNKVTKEYKALIEFTRRRKPLKIVEILEVSSSPGESKFAIQLINKNCFLSLTAAEIISNGYDLNEFSDFHAEMIRKAAQGKLIEFLNGSEKTPSYKIVSKRFDAKIQQYVFTIETKEQVNFIRTANEITNDTNLLRNMDFSDIYDIGYTRGCESILKEKAAILLSKHK